MSLIGIIANPSSGKDIRRLVAEASGMDNREKVHIVRRLLLGIAAVGVDEVAFMPDRFGIVRYALDGLTLPFRVSPLDMRINASQEDSHQAAQRFRQQGAKCIVVLGGDGTHRVVAKGSGKIPLVPISTGTNNVWPKQHEGTLAGLAAALVARNVVPLEKATTPTKRLEVFRNSIPNDISQTARPPDDIALVDIAAYDSQVVGAKAVWEVDRIKELVLTTTESGTLGLSSIGGSLPKPEGVERAGLYLRIGKSSTTVSATIAPGMIRRVPIQHQQWFNPGECVAITSGPCLLALDGEREIVVTESTPVTIRLTFDGPPMVDVPTCLKLAADQGYFIDNTDV